MVIASISMLAELLLAWVIYQLTLGGSESIVAFHAGGPLKLADNAVRALDLIPELLES